MPSERELTFGTSYRLRVRPGAWTANLADPGGQRWAELSLLSAIDTVEGRDETSTIEGPDVLEAGDVTRLRWRLTSSRWAAKRLTIECAHDALALIVEVEGSGRISDVTFLAGRAIGTPGTGSVWSWPAFKALFNPAPSDPALIALPATADTDIAVSGSSDAGRGQWFFTPAPFWYAVNPDLPLDPAVLPSGPWLGFGLSCTPKEQRFLGFGYRARDGGFGFELDYEGHTEVAGSWRSPALQIAPVREPFEGLRAFCDRVRSTGAVPAATPHPAWWLEPIFSGWGAQSAMATERGEPLSMAKVYATQAHYDRWLDGLEARGVIPGTVVIDDKWQRAYGTCEPDAEKWPDLRAWIAERHECGQRVLLWWKAWDPEGVAPERCVRTMDGIPVAIDPNHPGGRDQIRAAVRRMLDPDGLAADGLKIDFTAATPSGRSLLHHPGTWGVDLLRTLLQTVREEAKRANAECLLVGHVPEPTMAPLVDMIRLNDLLRLDDLAQPASVVPQMQHRAAVVRAAAPDHPIDTDDWCALDLADWRRYTTLKPQLGVPALYYAEALDRLGERLEPRDFELVAETWREYRRAHGLPDREEIAVGKRR